jgi:tyrosyl-tRNA synthetase
MRQMLSYEQIDANVESIQKQLDRFLGFDGKTAQGENNKNWLADLNYIDFLREIGSCFSVNKMLTFESYKKRLETGLSFIEFNYQLLQSFDFLQLYRRRQCVLQIGGDDQWGNIVAGVDLIRRKTGGEAYGLTFPLVTTSDGKKMGKTEKGALCLDSRLTPVFDCCQYWRNVTDQDVRKFLLLFTFLQVSEIDSLLARDINAAKERLAWEITAIIHGKAEADKALAGAKAAFGNGGDRDSMPSKKLPKSGFDAGYNVADLFTDAGLCPSKSESRRLVQQGGAFVSDRTGELQAVLDVAARIGAGQLDDQGELTLRAGKKRYCRVVAKG